MNIQHWIKSNEVCWMKEQSGEILFTEVIIKNINQEKKTITINRKQGEQKGDLILVNTKNKLFERGDTSKDHDYQDMTEMKILNEAEIFNNLKYRFLRDQIFTYIGPTLIAVNPYKKIDQLFNESLIEQIIENFKKQDDKKQIPHTFSIAALAYRQMIQGQQNQAILISGESGAGQTENAKLAMKFITDLTSQASDTGFLKGSRKFLTENQDLSSFSIESQILSCNPILQAFGNAQTVRNDNSSRFGKYMQIFINRVTLKIQGSAISNYLLEKSRVPTQAKGERNYHIFYYILKGMSPNLKQKYFDNETLNMQDFRYLRSSDCFTLDSSDDAVMFKEVVESFQKMNFLEEETDTVYQILATLLKIGNIEFSDVNADENNPCVIQNKDLFIKTCQLLELNPQSLEDALVYKTRIINKGVIKSALKLFQCEGNRQSLCKSLYQWLFNWLVNKLNQGLLPTVDEKYCHIIGLLDIFGFENFKVNSFEQLCINYTNQQLQQLYIQYIFKDELAEYRKDGLDNIVNQIMFSDNQNVIDLIEKQPMGIMMLLDEETSIQKGSDENFLSQMIKEHHNQNNCFYVPKIMNNSFTINHTAKDVEYMITGFQQKNRDEISVQLIQVFQESLNQVIKDIVPNTSQLSASSTSKFLGSKFRTQLNDLMQQLYKCDAHFIRCIQTNQLKQKNLVVQSFMFQQVQYLGLLDSVKIRLCGFPNQILYDQFYKKYHGIFQQTRHISLQNERLKNNKENIMQIIKDELIIFLLDSKTEGILYGKSKIYLKDDQMAEITKQNNKFIQFKKLMVGQIQQNWRRFKLRQFFFKAYETFQNHVIKIQKAIRGYQMKQKFLNKKQSIIIIKKFLGKQIATNSLLKLRQNMISYHINQLITRVLRFQLLRGLQFIKEKANKKKQMEEKLKLQNPDSNLLEKQEDNEQIQLESTYQSQELLLGNQFQVSLEEIQQQDESLDQNNESNPQISINLIKLIEENNNEADTQDKPQNFNNSQFGRKSFPTFPPGAIRNSCSSPQRISRNSKNNSDGGGFQYLIDTTNRYSELAQRGFFLQPNNKGNIDPSVSTELITKMTQYCEVDFEQQIEMNLEEIPESNDCNFEWAHLNQEFLESIKQMEFHTILSALLAQRSTWGFSVPADKIMLHQSQPIDSPLTNLKQIEQTISDLKSLDSKKMFRTTHFQRDFFNKKLDFISDFQNNSDCFTRAENLQQRVFLFPFPMENLTRHLLLNPKQEITYKTLSDLSVQCFQLILQYTGERKSRYPQSKNLQDLIQICIENENLPELAEEIYVQLLKQLTQTGNLQENDREETIFQAQTLEKDYWELLSIIASVLPPTERIYGYILNWLLGRNMEEERQTNKKSAEIQQFSQYIFMRIFKNQLLPRAYPPSQLEIEMIKSQKSLIIQVYIFTGAYFLIPIESYTQIGDIKQMILSQIGLLSREQYFGILEIREVEGEIKERYSQDTERAFDIIGFWEQAKNIILSSNEPHFSQIQKQAISSFRLRFYLGVRTFYTFFENEQETISMIYAQSYWEVHQNQYSLINQDICNLAALQMVVENVNPNKIPEKEFEKYINRYVPVNFRDKLSCEVWWKILKDASAKVKGKNANSAKLAYLMYLRKQAMFMCTQFPHVKYISYRDNEKPKSQNNSLPNQDLQEIVMAINGFNIVVCEIKPPYRPIKKILLSQILRWAMLKSQISILSIDGVRHAFVTERIHEISHLIKNYLIILNNSQKKYEDEDEDGGEKLQQNF